MKGDDIVADAAERLKILGVRLAMGLLEFSRLDAKRIGRQLLLVELAAVFQNGRQAALLHVAADALDDLLGRQRLAEELDRPPAARLGDDLASRAELVAQRRDQARGIIAGTVDRGNCQRFQGRHTHLAHRKPITKHRKAAQIRDPRCLSTDAVQATSGIGRDCFVLVVQKGFLQETIA